MSLLYKLFEIPQNFNDFAKLLEKRGEVVGIFGHAQYLSDCVSYSGTADATITYYVGAKVPQRRNPFLSWTRELVLAFSGEHYTEYGGKIFWEENSHLFNAATTTLSRAKDMYGPTANHFKEELLNRGVKARVMPLEMRVMYSPG